MAGKVLITGGSGMIGRAVTDLLRSHGYEVVHLSRGRRGTEDVRVFTWDYQRGHLEEGVLDGVEYIVHLAGADVSSGRWTERRKKTILQSRTKTADLLHGALAKSSHSVKALISASGITIYGHDTGDQVCTEQTEARQQDFLSHVAVAWEDAADRFSDLGIRVVKLRTGVVLSREGGALPKFLLPARLGLGAAIGSGEQYLSWIHQTDQARLIRHALEHDALQGAYNAVAPEPVRNKEMMRAIADHLHRPFFLPNVPAFVLRAVFGELSSVVLGGNYVSSEKIRDAGFEFEYPDLDAALGDLLG